MPVPPGQTQDLPEFNITVMDSKPIWVFCQRTYSCLVPSGVSDSLLLEENPFSHCHKGMVFAVNCGATGSANSFDNFKAAALALGAADASSSAAAAAASSAAPAGTDAPAASVTIPPAPPIATVTEAITLDGSTWTTTYGSYPNSPAPTPASLTGNVINVVVGGNSTLTFNPSFIKAYVPHLSCLCIELTFSSLIVCLVTPLCSSSRPRTTVPRSRASPTHACI